MKLTKTQKMVAKLKAEAKNPDGLLNLAKNAKKMSSKMTWPEREFKKLLKELGVKFEVQKVIGNKIFDFYIPDCNLLVEIDGDYYHGNSKKFKPSELNGLQKKNIRNDKFKDGLADGLGYGIERVWENDLKVNYSKVKSRFKKIILG